MTIVYTDATWNPWIGCSPIGAGCLNCYAAKRASVQLRRLPQYAGLTKDGKWLGILRQQSDLIWNEPMKRKKPTRFFVGSYTDIFHADAPPEWKARLWAIMLLCPHHTFVITTKRPALVYEFVHDTPWSDVMQWCNKISERYSRPHHLEAFWAAQRALPWATLENLWLGISVSTQEELALVGTFRTNTFARVRWLSVEPMVEPMSLVDAGWLPSCPPDSAPLIDWVVCGGESGPDSRPFHVEWAASLLEECRNNSVPFFMKQLGSSPLRNGTVYRCSHPQGEDTEEWPAELCIRQVPNKDVSV